MQASCRRDGDRCGRRDKAAGLDLGWLLQAFWPLGSPAAISGPFVRAGLWAGSLPILGC